MPPRTAEAALPATLQIRVVDALSQHPIPLVIVDIHGEIDRRAVTDGFGKATLRDVPPGPYVIAATASGYFPGVLQQIDVVPGAQRSVRFALRMLPPSLRREVQLARPPTIATVRTGAQAPQAHTDSVSSSSVPTRISDSVLYALGTLPGFSLQPPAGDGGISVGGRSTEETQLSLDGVPLVGPAQGLSLFSSGIFGGASGDIGTSSLSFTTPDPTLDWLGRILKDEGDNAVSRLTLSESGTSNRLGMSVAYASVASQTSALNGMRFLDSSGLDYMHDATSHGNAFAVKIRYPTSRSNSLLYSYDVLQQAVPVVCDVYTASVPCGYGPVDRNDISFKVAQLRDSWAGALADGSISLFSSSNATDQDGSGVYDAGVSAPTSSMARSRSLGINLSSAFHVAANYDLRAIWQTMDTRSEYFSESGIGSDILQYPSVRTSELTISAPLIQVRRVTSSVGVSQHSQLGNVADGVTVNVAYRPTNLDTVTARYRSGILSRPTAFRTYVGSPSGLSFDCTTHTALGAGPSAEGGDTKTSLLGLTWSHAGRRITSEISVTHAVDRNALVDSTVSASSLDPSLFGPTYLAGLAAAGDRACGNGSAYTLPDVLLDVAGIAPRAAYDNYQASAQVAVGPDIVTALSAGITLARAYGSSSPIFSTRSTVVEGRQLPGRPYATASWSLAYGTGRGPLVLIDANYVSKNNPNALPPYTTVDASLSVPTAHGQLSLSASNLTNVFPGPFATSTNSVALPMQVGSYRPPAEPLTPRTLWVTYRVQVGRNPESLEAMSANGSGRFIRYDASDSRGPLDIDRQSTLCGPELVEDTQALFAAIGAYANAIRAAAPNGELPSVYPDGAYQGLRLIYRRSGQSFDVLLGLAPKASRAQGRIYQKDIFACGTFRTGTLDQARRANLYVPSWSERTTQHLLLGFSPQLGFYDLPQLIEEPAVQYLPLPTEPPTDPFALNSSPACAVDVRPAAATFLDILRNYAKAYFGSGSIERVPGVTFVPRARNGRRWIEIPDDDGLLGTLMPCLVVHAARAEQLARLDIEATPGTLAFSPDLGLYLEPSP